MTHIKIETSDEDESVYSGSLETDKTESADEDMENVSGEFNDTSFFNLETNLRTLNNFINTHMVKNKKLTSVARAMYVEALKLSKTNLSTYHKQQLSTLVHHTYELLLVLKYDNTDIKKINTCCWNLTTAFNELPGQRQNWSLLISAVLVLISLAVIAVSIMLLLHTFSVASPLAFLGVKLGFDLLTTIGAGVGMTIGVGLGISFSIFGYKALEESQSAIFSSTVHALCNTEIDQPAP